MANLDEEWEMFDSNNLPDDGEIKKINSGFEPDFSPLIISTMTKSAHLNLPVSYDIFWDIPIVEYYLQKEGVVKKEMHVVCQTQEELDKYYERVNSIDSINNVVKDTQIISFKSDAIHKKFTEKHKISIGVSVKDVCKTNKSNKKAFYNCFVLMIRINIDGTFQEMHVKVFNTGKIEIPGVKSIDQFQKTLDAVCNILNKYSDKQYKIIRNSYKNVLLNSKFIYNHKIDRDVLVEILKNKYNINCQYDETRYPGINCAFYYDNEKTKQDGIFKKGLSKISIMIFRTGNILILGKCDVHQAHDIYNFIKNILVEHHDIVNEGIDSPKKDEKKTKKRKKYISILQ